MTLNILANIILFLIPPSFTKNTNDKALTSGKKHD